MSPSPSVHQDGTNYPASPFQAPLVAPTYATYPMAVVEGPEFHHQYIEGSTMRLFKRAPMENHPANKVDLPVPRAKSVHQINYERDHPVIVNHNPHRAKQLATAFKDPDPTLLEKEIEINEEIIKGLNEEREKAEEAQNSGWMGRIDSELEKYKTRKQEGTLMVAEKKKSHPDSTQGQGTSGTTE